MKPIFRSLVTGVVCIAGLAVLQFPRLKAQLSASETDAATLQAEDLLQRERLRLWRTLPVFGFDNLVADWAFLNFLQYFGDSEARQVTGYPILPAFFEVTVQRDPHFSLPYRFLSSSVTLFAGQPTETVALLEAGLNQMIPTFPEDAFWLWRYKAIDELLFLGDVDATIRSLESNAEWALQSPVASSDDLAASARRLANFLRQNPDSRQVRASSWVMVWGNAINQDARQYAQKQIESLGYRVNVEGDRIQIEDTMP